MAADSGATITPPLVRAVPAVRPHLDRQRDRRLGDGRPLGEVSMPQFEPHGLPLSRCHDSPRRRQASDELQTPSVGGTLISRMQLGHPTVPVGHLDANGPGCLGNGQVEPGPGMHDGVGRQFTGQQSGRLDHVALTSGKGSRHQSARPEDTVRISREWG